MTLINPFIVSLLRCECCRQIPSVRDAALIFVTRRIEPHSAPRRGHGWPHMNSRTETS
jgi:hypothetical protein